jgi:hypothetical protein
MRGLGNWDLAAVTLQIRMICAAAGGLSTRLCLAEIDHIAARLGGPGPEPDGEDDLAAGHAVTRWHNRLCPGE